ncbi:CoxG family protein [Piscinibacter sakaiensis]|uniref:CoxG family protein n=1 Tax=Piscinibacter sakaiensis TaxID=1547922 RepID=UPI00372D03BC
MELQGERLIPATVPQTWEALNDPETLKGCIAGCETLERVGDDGFTAVVAVKVGPVSARFKGNLKLTNVQAPDSYTINFDGQGGVAGFGKGSADVALSPEGGQTRLKYLARAQVGGKMAQVGSRLIDAAAGKIAEDFFKAFEATLTARYPAPAAAPAAASRPAVSRDGASRGRNSGALPWTASTCRSSPRPANGTRRATPCGWSPSSRPGARRPGHPARCWHCAATGWWSARSPAAASRTT